MVKAWRCAYVLARVARPLWRDVQVAITFPLAPRATVPRTITRFAVRRTLVIFSSGERSTAAGGPWGSGWCGGVSRATSISGVTTYGDEFPKASVARTRKR